MKKTAFTALATTALLTGLAFSASSALAEDGSAMTSKGSISYVTDTSSVNTVDPLDPHPDRPMSPLDPDDHEAPTAGPLSIDYVSNIRFGAQKTTGTDQTYFAELDTLKTSDGEEKSLPNFVQVTDKRGSNAGWHLTVTQEGQFKSGKEELTGAALQLSHAVLSSPDQGEAPTAAEKPLVLTPGQASDVLNAQANQGTGTWLNRFGADEAEGKTSISLTVPGKTKKVQGEYETRLLWTLTDTPA